MKTIKRSVLILFLFTITFTSLYAGGISLLLKGTWNDNLYRPTRVSVNADGKIAVADNHRKQIYIFAGDHRFISSVPLPSSPLSVAFAVDGNLYVGIQNDILKINLSGEIVDRFSSHGISLQAPMDIAVEKSGLIYVVDRDRNSVSVYSSAFELQRTFGTPGMNPGEFRSPIGLALDASTGEIIIADGGNSRIQIFSTDGNYRRVFGEHIKQTDTTWQVVGTFARMQGVAVDAHGRIYVTDGGLDHVQIFDTNGNHLGFLGKEGPRASRLHVPMGITVSSSGKLLVTSLTSSEVKEYIIEYTTGVEPSSSSAPAKYMLEQNYPNPFNPTTQIRFSIPASDFVALTIYDIVGREIAVLANGDYQSGSYTIEWNGRNTAGTPAASGIYFYHLQVGDKFSQTNKMIFLK